MVINFIDGELRERIYYVDHTDLWKYHCVIDE